MSKCVGYTIVGVVLLVSGAHAGDKPAKFKFKDYTPTGKQRRALGEKLGKPLFTAS